ncbi:MAG: FtsX-like permease family protein [Roseiflexaceae bacterium]|nr:FtsX-like permease family protein [Roseiflexaceae bacterium]
MNSFYTRYAFRSLRRSGQRTVLAGICVAFGVMSLVSLWLLASIIRDAVIVEPRVGLGGDAQLLSSDGSGTSLQRELDQLRSDGVIDRALVFSEQRGLVLKPASAPVFILDRALGVNPQAYPLLGTLQLRDGRSLADTLQQPGDIVVSRDVATTAQLALGDTVLATRFSGTVPVRLRVVGIADQMPNNVGATAIFTVATAQQIAGHADVLGSALVTWGARGAALETTQCADDGQLPGFANTATERIVCMNQGQLLLASNTSDSQQRVVRVFDTMLKGTGLLGLLVGGIGVANTLYVLLARRTGEIAVLKTLGYGRREIVFLIALETALLGAAGSVVGVVVAVALSYLFTVLLGNTGGSLMASWRVDPWALGGGGLAGVVTSVLFGVAASVRASAVRPAALLRNQVDPPQSTRRVSALLWLAIGLLFAALSSVILGSLLLGAGVLAVAVSGLVVLGGGLGGMLALLVRVPSRARSIAALAQHNLRQQGMRSIFAVIALWAGVFAIGLAAAALWSASDRVAGKAIDLGGDNVVVYARSEDQADVEQYLHQNNTQQLRSQVVTSVDVRRADGKSVSIFQIAGRAALGSDVQIQQGPPWGTQPGVYIDRYLLDDQEPPLAIGDMVTVSTTSGTRAFPILGVFLATGGLNPDIQLSQPGLLALDTTVRELGGDQTVVQVIGQAVPDQLRQIGGASNTALPNAMVLTSADFNDALIRTFTSLFLFVLAVAGLALVAGAVLIANAVGLALIERRRELGILKAVGYSSGQVLRTLLIEHSVLGLVGGVAGIASVFVAIAVINQREAAARLALDPLPALLLVSIAVVLAVMSTLLVAWQPTHVRPSVVLRDA